MFAGEAEDYAPKLFVDLAEAGPKTTFEEVSSGLYSSFTAAVVISLLQASSMCACAQPSCVRRSRRTAFGRSPPYLRPPSPSTRSAPWCVTIPWFGLDTAHVCFVTVLECLQVEHLFTSVLPVPEPWSEELAASAAPGPWIPVDLSLNLQRSVLRALNRVCVHYVAASKSLKYDRSVPLNTRECLVIG